MQWVEAAAQQLLVRRASRWLPPADRALLSLWRLELAGAFSRAEVATALGTCAAEADARVRRMRERLELSRAVVGALDGPSDCAELDALTATWNGVPGPFWRERIGRHACSCGVCKHAWDDLVPLEAVFAGVALLPVPAPLAAAVAQIVETGIGSAGRVPVDGRQVVGRTPGWAARRT